MTNVCMITTNHSPFDGRIFYKEAKSLKNVGYDVTVIGQTNPKMNKVVDGINIVGIKKGMGIKSHPFLWRRLLKEALDVNADIYHCHEPESFLVASYLKIFKRKKIVYDVHEYYIDVLPLASPQMKMFLGVMLYFVEPLFCKYADAIITADEAIAKRYRKFNNNVHSVFNFPSFGVFKLSSSQDVKKIYKNHFVIIYVGGMSEERGIFELIKGVHKVSETYPSVKLLLLGNFGTKNFEGKCTGYVQSNDLDENVDFLGFVPHTEIPKYISTADVGAVLLKPIPKFYKNIPIKQFEYMVCKKPVIGSNLPPITRYVENAGCGIIVDPNDINEIAEAIIYLLEHPDEAKKMGESGRRAVEEKYNWNEMEKNLVWIYSKIGD